MQIIPLPEGVFTIDKTKVFVPFNLSEDELQNRPTGSLLVEIQPFVVITANDVLLLDTGLGFSKNGQLQLYTNLEKNNIKPQQVTKVLLSHLHKDHAGGACIEDDFGNSKLAFENAIYYLQEKELAFAFETGFPSYITQELAALQSNSNVVLLHGDGLIDNYIKYQVTGGHCPYHQVFWIEENNETVFFGGDEAPQLQQMKTRYIAKYDYDGKKNMELRRSWWQQGKEENWNFLFYHDVKTPLKKSE